ncbi:hypothetical protein L249_0802, partial [Ophiocordyceps polyrhachis-furcata BCC 54312]
EIRIELYSGLRVEYYSTKRGLAIRRRVLAALPAIIAPYSSGTILTLVNNLPIDCDLIFFPNFLSLSVPNILEIEGEYGVKICALNYDLASKVKQLVDSLPKLLPRTVYDYFLLRTRKSYYSSYRLMHNVSSTIFFALIKIMQPDISTIFRLDSLDRCDTLFPASHNGSNYCRNAKHLYSVKDENPMPPLLVQREIPLLPV